MACYIPLPSGKSSPGLPHLKSRKTTRQYSTLPPLPHSPPPWVVRGPNSFQQQQSMTVTTGGLDQMRFQRPGGLMAAGPQFARPQLTMTSVMGPQQLAGPTISSSHLSGVQLSGPQISGHQLAGAQISGQPVILAPTGLQIQGMQTSQFQVPTSQFQV